MGRIENTETKSRETSLIDITARKISEYGLCSVVVSIGDSSIVQLASQVQSVADKYGVEIPIEIVPSHSEALHIAEMNDAAAIVPIERGIEAMKEGKHAQLCNVRKYDNEEVVEALVLASMSRIVPDYDS